MGVTAWAGTPILPSPPTLPPALREDPKAFPGQLGDIVTPACPGSSSGFPPGRICQEHLPAKETHFSHLYPGSYSLGHDPKFMTIGEGRNVD